MVIRPPPASPLFPYTTLFRSQSAASWAAVATENWTSSAHGIKLDRKSTRLNSSHSQISYAVFCLKKKKATPAEQAPPYAAAAVRTVVDSAALRYGRAPSCIVQ